MAAFLSFLSLLLCAAAVAPAPDEATSADLEDLLERSRASNVLTLHFTMEASSSEGTLKASCVGTVARPNYGEVRVEFLAENGKEDQVPPPLEFIGTGKEILKIQGGVASAAGSSWSSRVVPLSLFRAFMEPKEDLKPTEKDGHGVLVGELGEQVHRFEDGELRSVTVGGEVELEITVTAWTLSSVDDVTVHRRELPKDVVRPTRRPAIGELAPEITGTDIDGDKFKLSDYRGKVVMLDFWGDW